MITFLTVIGITWVWGIMSGICLWALTPYVSKDENETTDWESDGPMFHIAALLWPIVLPIIIAYVVMSNFPTTRSLNVDKEIERVRKDIDNLTT